jgi:ribonuclease BN (tRNA processing enzyme)
LISRIHALQPGPAALPHYKVGLRERPVSTGSTALQERGFRVETDSLSHSNPAIGYRLVEADRQRVLPDRTTSGTCGHSPQG